MWVLNLLSQVNTDLTHAYIHKNGTLPYTIRKLTHNNYYPYNACAVSNALSPLQQNII